MIHFIPLSGFLGAGKTTTLVESAKALERRGLRVSVVTNDQGTELIDTQLVRSHLDTVGEVTGGCFCCRFDDLMTVTSRLLDGSATDVVIAEAVGSCTDLQATVVRPLRALYGERFTVAPLTVVVDPVRYLSVSSSLPLLSSEEDMVYLYGHQLAEADIIAVNKIDLLTDDERTTLVSRLRADYPTATVLSYSARTGEGVPALLRAWDTAPALSPVVDIDYDRYAAAEAQLAWFNRRYALTAPQGFAPAEWATALLAHVSAVARARGWTVGHAKVAVETGNTLTKLSLTAAGEQPTVDLTGAAAAASAEANFNARIACEPPEMDALAEAAVAAANAAIGTDATPAVAAGEQIAFKPGYPRPVHRITEKVG